MTSATMTMEEEAAITLEMRALEQAARDLICSIPMAAEILNAHKNRSCKTNGVDIDRLIEAVKLCEDRLARLDSQTRLRVQQAARLMQGAEALRWKLGLTARHIVRLEASRLSNSMVGREDLVQHGYMGLINAAKRFDPEKGIRFVSYARWWVRAEMTSAIEHEGRTVRLPGGAVEQLRRIAKARKSLEREGVAISERTLAEETGLTVRRVRFLMSRGEVVSMEDSEDDGLSLYERIADEPEVGDVEEQLISEELLDRLKAVLPQVLNERDAYVLRRHYGLDGDAPATLTDLGRELGVSRERIRQLRSRALSGLRESIAA